jgi:phosphatidylethanolamine/phosphatidyl-N-methylethanolamine N-methyltransferase
MRPSLVEQSNFVPCVNSPNSVLLNLHAYKKRNKTMPRQGKLSSTALFLREWVANPKQVGAVLPSSRKLGAAMARWAPLHNGALALELGPGTGVVTEALIEKGLRPDRLIAVEYSAKMADLLRERFRGVRVITGDAFRVDELLKEHKVDTSRIEVVFSSLPLRNFSVKATEELARRIH